MAHKRQTLQQWIKQNSLPDELEDVLYEESIQNMGALKCISIKKFEAICRGLTEKMGNESFTKDVRLHLIECVKEISPKIELFLSGTIQMKHSAVHDNEIVNLMNSYCNEYAKSVEWIKNKQQGTFIFFQLILQLNIIFVNH